MNRSSSYTVNFVAACALLSILTMFITSFSQINRSLVKETRSRGVVSAGSGEASPAPDAFPALPAEEADKLAELMRTLQTSPTNADTLRRIGEIFIAAQDWARAEAFLSRAILSRPADIRPRYMLGISQYQQNKIDAAAATFEELLSIKDDPGAMYNLAIIYKYHTGQKDKAEDLLRKVIAFPGADADTINRAKAEQ